MIITNNIKACHKQKNPLIVSTMIIDSSLTFTEALADSAAPPEVLAQLVLLEVRYYSFDGKLHQGQLVINRLLQQEVAHLFARIKALRFPVAKALPIVRYGWSDGASMADNNASGFNYRFVAGTTRLSRHALGFALDINPRQNPVVYADGTILPPGATYDPRQAGTLSPASPVVREFLSRGWRWGGDFTQSKDYHHFEKAP